MLPAHADAGSAAAGIIQEPMRLTWNAALEETEMVLFESVHKLFKATGVNAQDVSPPLFSASAVTLLRSCSACLACPCQDSPKAGCAA